MPTYAYPQWWKYSQDKANPSGTWPNTLLSPAPTTAWTPSPTPYATCNYIIQKHDIMSMESYTKGEKNHIRNYQILYISNVCDWKAIYKYSV